MNNTFIQKDVGCLELNKSISLYEKRLETKFSKQPREYLRTKVAQQPWPKWRQRQESAKDSRIVTLQAKRKFSPFWLSMLRTPEADRRQESEEFAAPLFSALLSLFHT